MTIGPFVYPLFHYGRLCQEKEIYIRLCERRGVATLPRPQGLLIWFHAASNGESLSIMALIKALHDYDSGLNFLVTTGTVTSATLMTQHLPAYAKHQFVPHDVPQWINRFLNHWRPHVFVCVESELWPNLIMQTSARSIPMIIINASISRKSMNSWQWNQSLLKKMLQCFTLILTQSLEHTERLSELDLKTIRTVGNLKFASPSLNYDKDEYLALQTQLKGRPVWLAASTHEGEEDIIFKAHKRLQHYYPNLLTIIVPRHPTRRDQILQVLKNYQLSYAQRSADQSISTMTQIYLADTLGELGLFYKLSPLVFVGGSLDNTGGHNLIEPAHFDCALLHGPNMHKQQAMASLFAEAEAAIVVHDVDDLVNTIKRLFDDSKMYISLQQRAHDVANSQYQVLQQTLDHILPIIRNMKLDNSSYKQ